VVLYCDFTFGFVGGAEIDRIGAVGVDGMPVGAVIALCDVPRFVVVTAIGSPPPSAP
jgi:hypothetical protein